MKRLILVFVALLLALPAVAQQSPRQKALRLFERLTGVPLLAKDPRLAQMESLIVAGNTSAAAAIAIADDYFLNLTIKQWAAVMSNREETPFVPLNDFQAMVIGIARDDMDARQLLSGDFTYVGDPTKVRFNNRPDQSNNQHYEELENLRANLAQVLAVQAPQRQGQTEAAGVLTSRAWALAHLNMGTNRRAVQFTFQEFLCSPIEKWREPGLLDRNVRRDVERKPGGNPETYQKQCRTCHAGMDALAGAFARLDFVNNQLQILPPNSVARKYNQNSTVYPDGFQTVNDAWINRLKSTALGWRGEMKGMGVKAFGEMMANTEEFKRCMVKRVFKTVCKREPGAKDQTSMAAATQNFETNGYKLKALFQEVASMPTCLGN